MNNPLKFLYRQHRRTLHTIENKAALTNLLTLKFMVAAQKDSLNTFNKEIRETLKEDLQKALLPYKGDWITTYYHAKIPIPNTCLLETNSPVGLMKLLPNSALNQILTLLSPPQNKKYLLIQQTFDTPTAKVKVNYPSHYTALVQKKEVLLFFDPNMGIIRFPKTGLLDFFQVYIPTLRTDHKRCTLLVYTHR